MNDSPAPIRILGIGNVLMGDDGLGPAFAERIALAHLPGTSPSSSQWRKASAVSSECPELAHCSSKGTSSTIASSGSGHASHTGHSTAGQSGQGSASGQGVAPGADPPQAARPRARSNRKAPIRIYFDFIVDILLIYCYLEKFAKIALNIKMVDYYSGGGVGRTKSKVHDELS